MLKIVPEQDAGANRCTTLRLFAQRLPILLVILAALCVALLAPTEREAFAGNSTDTGGESVTPYEPECDPNWLTVPSPSIDREARTSFSDIEALSASNVWAVGTY